MAIGVSEDHGALAEAVRGWAERAGLRDSARAALEADEVRPEWFADLGRQGLLGLHVAEESGGSGAGGVELAVAVEQLGRALAHGPSLPTVFASLLLTKTAGTPAKELLPGLADGTSTGAVALTVGGLRATAVADGISVTGSVRPVLGGGLADLLVLGARDGDAQVWFVVESSQVVVKRLSGMDGTRRPAEISLDAVTVPASRLLPGLTAREVCLLVGVLVAAEAAGLAGWALDTATSYAKTREQFGRPIGAFQAVKHLCADMLVRAEQAAATAWDGARALDEPAGPERDLAAAVAISVAVEAAVDNAKNCLQVLGGIGYTWEHDAHVVLKRALSLRALVGDPSRWRGEVADLALAGARRRLELDLGDTDAVRDEVRAFVATKPDDVAIADGGYLMPHWPEPWGRNASAVEQLVIDQELAAAGIKRRDLVIGAWAAPTLVAHGTAEQQQRFVPATLRGEIVWCQMFSEPGAGSDLASLQTRAERVDGGWRISGQKVWTSMADVADWAILLARTDGTGKGPDRHKGITYFLLDMKTPGVDVRPLRELTGRAAFNEVFLDDVFVPDDCVVGEVGHGWKLARTTLANERVAMSSGSPFGRGVEDVLSDVAALPAVDAVLRDRVGHLVCEAQGQALLAFRTTLRRLSGADPGPASSVRKLVGMKHQQDAAELRYELVGAEGVTAEGAAGRLGHTMLNTRCLTIAGGTSEVLRNVIGERILGLPRDDR
ncbi:MAG: acyl-CoA dehydrogenase domain protein [Frankiales bacterium]|nr:acyl-CoA dehydrogenase domain protein [Frankiales bacterium]